MIDKIKFPYMNMQQLNLDWLMEHIANMPEIVHVPALTGDQLSDVCDMIDREALVIPKGMSYMQAGVLDDPLDRQCVVWIFKADNDNIRALALGFSSDIGVWFISKDTGVWYT